MNFFQIFVFISGVLGKRMLNPEVLKCHEDIITLDTYVQQGKTMVTMAGDNKFYIYSKTRIYQTRFLRIHGVYRSVIKART